MNNFLFIKKMHKLKTLDFKNKKNKSPKVQLARKKTYDYKNIINLDDDISEMDVNIKQIPTIKTKNLFLQNSIAKKPNNNNIINLKNKNSFNISTYKHSNSITTNTSCREKTMKKVTFSTVEIIRVEKYKKYNASFNYSKNLIKKNMEEIKENDNEQKCVIF